MAKFIIEVSDEYIREHADGEKMAERMAAGTDKDDAITALLDIVKFSTIKEDLDNGQSEFIVSVDDMDNDKWRKMFNAVVSRISSMFVIKKIKED